MIFINILHASVLWTPMGGIVSRLSLVSVGGTILVILAVLSRPTATPAVFWYSVEFLLCLVYGQKNKREFIFKFTCLSILDDALNLYSYFIVSKSAIADNFTPTFVSAASASYGKQQHNSQLELTIGDNLNQSKLVYKIIHLPGFLGGE